LEEKSNVHIETEELRRLSEIADKLGAAANYQGQERGLRDCCLL